MRTRRTGAPPTHIQAVLAKPLNVEGMAERSDESL